VQLDLNIVKEKYAFLDLQIIDLFGKLRHVSLPTSYLSEKILDEGIGFDASNLMLAEVTSSDLVIKPDFSTAHEDPFSQSPTICMLGNIYYFPTPSVPTLFPFDGRSTIARSIEYLKDQKIASNLMILPELEFYVFDEIEYSVVPEESYVSIQSSEKIINEKKGYHISKPFDTLSDVRSNIVLELEKIGIPVKYHHHEVGLPGQCEIELNFMDACKCADSILLAKNMVMNVCQENGQMATFLPKPIYSAPGSGMHMHMFLVDSNGQSIFFDSNHSLRLSTTGLYFMGGILKHLGAIMAFSNPSTNSYKRLIPGYEAPQDKSFAQSNREASIRIPAYTSLEETRFEFRTGDATANPYYAISAILLAGIDGINNKIDPYDNQAIANDKAIPRNLMEAMDALKKDNAFLLPIFSEALLKSWIHYKMIESRKATYFPNPAEFEIYGNY
jgi:glutamine synthetase